MQVSPTRRTPARTEFVPATVALGSSEAPPTNPPVKLLLNRRRHSGDSHTTAVVAHSPHQHRAKVAIAAAAAAGSPPRVCREDSLPATLGIGAGQNAGTLLHVVAPPPAQPGA